MLSTLPFLRIAAPRPARLRAGPGLRRSARSRAPQRRSVAATATASSSIPASGRRLSTTWRLRSSLEARGFVRVDWGFGLNRGPQGGLPQWLGRSPARSRTSARDGRKVSLVGWSLGGIFAREIARVVPHAVRQVVTLGSPFGAEADDDACRLALSLLSGSRPPQSRAPAAGAAAPAAGASTSIFSKADGIVPWQGCLQKEGPLAENIEVPGSATSAWERIAPCSRSSPSAWRSRKEWRVGRAIATTGAAP
jgi:hypothetical protein